MAEAIKIEDRYTATRGSEPILSGLKLSDIIIEAAQSKKALEMVRMDMRTVNGIADYFVLCTGEADQQIKAIVDEVKFKVKEMTGELPWRVEGYEHRQWVLVDFVNVVFHAFNAEKRQFYNLERLWADAETEFISDDS